VSGIIGIHQVLRSGIGQFYYGIRIHQYQVLGSVKNSWLVDLFSIISEIRLWTRRDFVKKYIIVSAINRDEDVDWVDVSREVVASLHQKYQNKSKKKS